MEWNGSWLDAAGGNSMPPSHDDSGALDPGWIVES